MTAGRLVALDTATQQATLAIGDEEGRLIAGRAWQAGYRHGETLLATFDALLDESGERLEDVAGIVAGIGPGAFTGLRVGLATAKTLAYALERPIVGVSTALTLAAAASTARGRDADGRSDEPYAVVMPAGPSARYLTVARVEGGVPSVVEEPRLVGAGASAREAIGRATAIAVDLPEDEAVGPDAHGLGRLALRGLGAALLAAGAGQLRTGRADDLAALVPAYVTLPRGLEGISAGSVWSPELA